MVFLLCLSVACLLVSLGIHLVASLGGPLPHRAVFITLLVGIFVLGLPAVAGHPGAEHEGTTSRISWRIVLELPLWTKVGLATLFVYGAWFVLRHDLLGHSIEMVPVTPTDAQSSSLMYAWVYAWWCALLDDGRRRKAREPF
jgi:hypothetical protein